MRESERTKTAGFSEDTCMRYVNKTVLQKETLKFNTPTLSQDSLALLVYTVLFSCDTRKNLLVSLE